MKVAIIGAGNVAWHLAQALEQAGHEINLIYNHNLPKAQELAQQLKNAIPTNSENFTAVITDVFIVSLADQAVVPFLEKAKFPEQALVAHTSGSLSLAVFSGNRAINGGVFYPLQTFSKSKKVDFKQIPVCLEASRKQDFELLQKLAQRLSNTVVAVNSEERKWLHVSAVFACNFTNHLLGISRDLLQRKQLPPTLLEPLIRETLEKALSHDPFLVQTGPAARHDENIIQEHLKLLHHQEPVYRQIYALITESIWHKSEK